ncbi:MAG: DUF2628 domain-containing protein [Alphaproteobacteria bacterium]|nr:MAG: DUF2628 domain-containing protein [Alphaproteobacteria bacterium]
MKELLITMLSDKEFLDIATTDGKKTKQTEYYLAAYKKWKKDRKFTLNWCAFLFFAFWMMYRKMYLTAIIFGTIAWTVPLYLTSFVIKFSNLIPLEKIPMYSGLVSLIIYLFTFGLFGNIVYFHFVDTMHQLKYKKIGTNKGIIWAFFCVLFIVSVLLGGLMSLDPGFVKYFIVTLPAISFISSTILPIFLGYLFDRRWGVILYPLFKIKNLKV